MAPGRRHPRPGGRLAGPAPSRQPARRRPDLARRPAAGGDPGGDAAPRSAACSTSPAPVRASAWSSRPRSPRTTTESSPRASLPSWATSPSTPSGDRSARSPSPDSSPTCAGARRPGVAARSARRGRRTPRAARRHAGARSSGRGRGRPRHVVGDAGALAVERPVRPDDAPVALSASALEGLLTCPAQWFLEREAGGRQTSSASQGFGNLVHALADRVARGEIAQHGDIAEVVDDLMSHVDQVWDRLAFRTPWSRSRERVALHAALSRFLAWHRRPGAATRVETEVSSAPRSACPTGSGCSSTVAPTAWRSTTPATSWSSTSRPASTYPPTSPCPTTPSSASTSTPSTPEPSTTCSAARRRRRAPPWSSCVRAPTCPRCSSKHRGPNDDGLRRSSASWHARAAVVRAEDFPATPVHTATAPSSPSAPPRPPERCSMSTLAMPAADIPTPEQLLR